MKKEYFRSLDALRFFAFFAVFISHVSFALILSLETSAFSWVKTIFLINGSVGVNFFFTLSGFLITYLLLRERERLGKIKIPNFFMKRLLRIWPVYYLTIFAAFIVIPLVLSFLSHIGIHTPASAMEGISPALRLPWLIIFLGNLPSLNHGPTNLSFSPLWSISVEEQFYLIWPWVISYFPTRHLPKLFISLIIGSLLFRMHYMADLDVIKYSSLSVLSDLVIGALLAYAITYWPSVREYFTKLSRKSLWSPVIFVFILMPISRVAELGYLGVNGRALVVVLPIVFCVLFAYIIGIVCFGKFRDRGLLNNKSLVYLGTISYGLYCYHGLGILAAKLMSVTSIGTLMPPVLLWSIEILSAFGITLLLASLSHRYIEAPILKLKNRFEST